jgi:hypothetical protein
MLTTKKLESGGGWFEYAVAVIIATISEWLLILVF